MAPASIETMLRKAGKGYVLGVAANHVFNSWGRSRLFAGLPQKIAQSLPKSAWRRLSSGEGTKGPRLHDWAYLELADLDAGNTTACSRENGRAVCWSAATLATAISPSSPHGARPELHREAGIGGRPSLGHRGCAADAHGKEFDMN